MVESGENDVMQAVTAWCEHGSVPPCADGSGAILIGSGSDVNGRALGALIDAGRLGWVGRVNRIYGEAADVGTRTDFLFTYDDENRFWTEDCLKRFGRVMPYGRLVNNQFRNDGCFYEDCKRRLRLKHPTTGIQAAMYLMQQGYRPKLVGFGFNGVHLVNPVKTYPDGSADPKTGGRWHDFDRENMWLLRWHTEGKLTLM